MPRRALLCATLGLGASPLVLATPLPYTCQAGSPSYGLPFCDPALPVEARVADLVARLDGPAKVQQFSIPVHIEYNEALNMKAFLWDMTCMRGIASGPPLQPQLNTTVYPHAIALGATWDVDLVARIGSATALEGRIISQVNYAATGGRVWQGVSCDGGPLANSAHDPRWGRASETYSECPFLISAMGVAATRALQNRSADRRWLATSQVTRHYLGYHGAYPDLPNQGEEFIDLYSFTEQQELPYRSFQLQGDAEGLMCAISAFSIGARSDWNTSRAPMTPSCAHPFLWAKLQQWGAQSFVQSDCCDSMTNAVDAHHYYPDISTAALAFVEAGVDASYGPNAAIDVALGAMLANGTLDAGLLDARIGRTLLTRFRLGEFDIGRNPAYPYAGPFNESALDGPEHRALAREAAAAAAVLLRNEGGLLPLRLRAGATLAVIGPFADCSNGAGGYFVVDHDAPLNCSYLHSYTGSASAVSTVLSAAREEAAAGGFTVTYVAGSNIITPQAGGIAAAQAAAAAADAVLLVVGLGSMLESEGTDRTTLQLPQAQQELVAAVTAAAGAKTVLCVVSGGTVDVPYDTAAAAVQLWYPGEEGGHGLLDVVTGRVNPSGRLPLTVYREAYLGLVEPLPVFALVSPDGVGRTYRFVNDSAAGGGGTGSLVTYWFGYGLSYTRFVYSGLTASLVNPAPGPGAEDTAPFAVVSAAVTNAGAVEGREVAQLYVSLPTGPIVANATGGAPVPKYSLSGFTRTAVLQPQETAQLSWTVPLRQFQHTGLNGQRLLTGGAYVLAVSGHLPDDSNGGAGASNVVTTVIHL